MKQRALLRSQAHPLRLAGPIIEARLPGVTVGEICHIYASRREKQTIARAQVLGFNRDVALLSLTGSAKGLSREAVIAPAGHGLNIVLRPDLAGSVLDATGNIVQRLAASSPTAEQELRAIDSRPPEWHQRIAIGQPFVTGIRAIDGLLTCGVGQRLGIFAAAGCGKTTLMHMLIANADADIFVIALIGERGREVTEFVSALRHSARQQQCIVVSATSDYSALDRCNAALVATTVAEYFRDQGKKVVLFFDSVTRYARALRDVALAAGEFPARRGFPASVFEALPKILERPGCTRRGSITAFYTILLESEEEEDPLADEIRSILDGHIYLSRKLAAKNHYPAIDVLRSISRISNQVCSQEHQQLSREVRRMLATLEEMQLLLELGEYQPGQNAENDRAFNKQAELSRWLCQQTAESTSFDSMLRSLRELAA
ncbi:type III secretion system ATPase SctN [[Erwinia] mediterraneensis]|uniref:type III secretion system ATPase SctN n=1 Tax=[Erwinia] mediterraneensis TaxID=2161819 RepID=UPI00103271D7|nr:type III secretion system ATPase SctN [[Erwinia] mediterraneensis]